MSVCPWGGEGDPMWALPLMHWISPYRDTAALAHWTWNLTVPRPTPDMGPHYTGIPWPQPPVMGPHRTSNSPQPPTLPFSHTWDLTVQGPPSPSPVLQTCSKLFNLNLTIQGPPFTCSTLFIMKHVCLASEWFASYWNTFFVYCEKTIKARTKVHLLQKW